MSRHDSKQIENVKVMLLKGESGSSIAGIAKTGTDGLVDTYTITLTDGSKTTFTVTNGKAITSVAKTGTQGLVDTYTITFNDNSTITFAITNGNGITSLEKTGTQGLVDTYTITFDNGSTQTFTVTNGEDGNGITSIVKTSTSGLVDTYTITFDNGSTETFDVTNGANGSDVSQSNLAPVETGNTASQSYAVGSHLIWNGIYYEVIQAIAVDGAFNVGVNLQNNIICQEIESLEEKVLYTNTFTNKTFSQIANTIYYALKPNFTKITRMVLSNTTFPVTSGIYQKTGAYDGEYGSCRFYMIGAYAGGSYGDSFGMDMVYFAISNNGACFEYNIKAGGVTFTDYKNEQIASCTITIYGYN